MNLLHERQIGFRSLTEQIDTTTSAGSLIFHVFGALAECERELIRERIRTGLAVVESLIRSGTIRWRLDQSTKGLSGKRSDSPGKHVGFTSDSRLQGRSRE